MSEKQKQTALALHRDGKPFREIGLRLGVTESHAKKLVRAALIAR